QLSAKRRQPFLPLLEADELPNSRLSSLSPSESRGQSQEKLPLAQRRRARWSVDSDACCFTGLATGIGTGLGAPFKEVSCGFCCCSWCLTVSAALAALRRSRSR